MSRSLARSHYALLGWVLVVSVGLLMPWEMYSSGARRLAHMLAIAPWLDKVAHLFLFGVLAFLGQRSLEALAVARPALIAVVGTVAFSAVLEGLQVAIPLRRPDEFDLLANLVGACAGAIMAVSTSRVSEPAGELPS